MEPVIETGTEDDLSTINNIYDYYVKESNATFDTEEWVS